MSGPLSGPARLHDLEGEKGRKEFKKLDLPWEGSLIRSAMKMKSFEKLDERV